MRTVFLLLLFANLVFFAGQFDVVRDVVRDALHEPAAPVRAAQVNAERLRLIRDTSVRAGPAS